MRWLCFFLLVLLVMLFFRRLHERYGNPDLRVTFFDVGQGDSLLLQWGIHTILVDAGGGNEKWNMGKGPLYLELARQGILSVEEAILTHPDRDHAAGFRGLLEQITFGRFFLNASFLSEQNKTPLLQDLLALTTRKKIRLQGQIQAETRMLDGVRLALLPPPKMGSPNNRSLVLEVEYAGCRLIFPGDLEAEGEQWLSKRVSGPVDVLKVAHHGSHSSSTWALLKKLRPVAAVISCGRKNPYHHPHREPLSRFRALRTQVLRTDFHGFVRFRIDRTGRAFCETFHGTCGEWRCALGR